MHLVEVSLVDQTPGEWHVDIGLILQPAASPMTFGVVLHDPSQPSSNDAFCGVNTQFQGIAPYVGDAGVSLATGAELPAGRLVTLRASLTTENGVLALSCSYGGAVFPLQLVAPLANVQIAITAEITDTITYLDVVERAERPDEKLMLARAAMRACAGAIFAPSAVMSWRDRLRELVRAGGAVALAGCFTSGGTPGSVPCGNASSDPCICGRDMTVAEKYECADRKTCESGGGTWSDPYDDYARGEADGGVPVCVYPGERHDAGVVD
jgi:hypothetical protein